MSDKLQRLPEAIRRREASSTALRRAETVTLWTYMIGGLLIGNLVAITLSYFFELYDSSRSVIVVNGASFPQEWADSFITIIIGNVYGSATALLMAGLNIVYANIFGKPPYWLELVAAGVFSLMTYFLYKVLGENAERAAFVVFLIVSIPAITSWFLTKDLWAKVKK